MWQMLLRSGRPDLLPWAQAGNAQVHRSAIRCFPAAQLTQEQARRKGEGGVLCPTWMEPAAAAPCGVSLRSPAIAQRPNLLQALQADVPGVPCSSTASLNKPHARRYASSQGKRPSHPS